VGRVESYGASTFPAYSPECVEEEFCELAITEFYEVRQDIFVSIPYGDARNPSYKI
jgi:hypothetical protein